MFYWKVTETYMKFKKHLLDGRKYSRSRRKLRPAGAEYEINDDQLRNLAAHSGFP